MRMDNYGFGMPWEILDTQEWFYAIDAYDYNDPSPLAALLESGQEIPEHYRKPIADIVRGVRKPNRKAAAKLKVPAAERMRAAATVSSLLGLIDTLKRDAIDPQIYPGERGLQMLAERRAYDYTDDGKLVRTGSPLEPSEVRAELERTAREEVIQQAANDLGVSTETIEELVRHLREKASKWPTV